MSNVNELKDQIGMKLWLFIVLAIFTGGIYPIMWLYRNNEILERITKTQTVTKTYLIWMAVVASFMGSFYTGFVDLSRYRVTSDAEVVAVLFFLCFIALSVMYILWAFKAKKALEDYALNELQINMKLNAAYTFFFTIFYILYCVNDIPEQHRRFEIIKAQMAGNVQK